MPRRRLSWFAAAFLLASTAKAAIYESPITAETEEQLVDLEQRGDISSSTLEILLELLDEGVDLNSAERDELYDLPGLTYTDVDAIITYRTAKGRIEDPAELVGAGALTAEQLLQIAPFIRIDEKGAVLPVSGKTRLVSAVTTTDDVAPPALLGAKVKGPFDLSAGVLLNTVRRQAGAVRYDPVLDGLTSSGHPYQAMLPRAFLQWNGGKRRVVVGTFTLGFAERLVLDNSRRNTPHGIYLSEQFRHLPDLSRACKVSSSTPEGPCADPDHTLYVTPDFAVRDAFRGIAASLEEVPIGTDGSFSAFGFLSYQSKSLYQYAMYDRRMCPDPNDDSNPACKAPPVYVDNPADPKGTKLIYSTLPYLYDELVGGAHFEVKPSYRYRLGFTGYGAAPFFHSQPMELDFQEWSGVPWGGPYGVIGVDGHAAFDDYNLFLEAARSFDHVAGGGGGLGAVMRSTFSPKHQEFELSVRYFDDKFATPYGRPVSAPDELDGQRARNELGARLRWYFSPNKDWEVKARADFWVPPYTSPVEGPAGTPNLYALARVDFNGWRLVQPAAWVDVRNRNLASNEVGKCSTTVLNVEGQPYLCNGDVYKIVGRLEFHLIPRYLDVITQGWFSWNSGNDAYDPNRVSIDEPTAPTDASTRKGFRNDVMLWAEVLSSPTEALHLRAKTRWLFQDISDNTNLEQSLWSFFEAEWMFGHGTSVLGRYDAFVWLDQRASTLKRVPNPEHRFFVDFRYAF